MCRTPEHASHVSVQFFIYMVSVTVMIVSRHFTKNQDLTPPKRATVERGKKKQNVTVTGNNLEQDQAPLGLTLLLMQRRRREMKPNDILSLSLFGLVKTSWPLTDQRPAKAGV